MVGTVVRLVVGTVVILVVVVVDVVAVGLGVVTVVEAVVAVVVEVEVMGRIGEPTVIVFVTRFPCKQWIDACNVTEYTPEMVYLCEGF